MLTSNPDFEALRSIFPLFSKEFSNRIQISQVVYSNDPLNGWAEAYKVLYGPGGADIFNVGDVSSYCQLAQEASGAVLELGCGTGRLTIPILEAGVDVCAVDISTSQTKILEREASDRGLEPEVIVGDMCSLELDKQFELIILPYETIRYALTPEKQLSCLRQVRRHLKPGGRVVLDFSRPEPEWSEDPRTLRADLTHEGDDYLLISTFELSDEIEQILHVDEKLYREGTLFGEHTVELARPTKREFEHLLERSGFSDWEVYADHEGTALSDASSKSMVWQLNL